MLGVHSTTSVVNGGSAMPSSVDTDLSGLALQAINLDKWIKHEHNAFWAAKVGSTCGAYLSKNKRISQPIEICPSSPRKGAMPEVGSSACKPGQL
ncbi:hypothetical protein Nepgr_013339 [Nepenthes gracilis]|uniref:Uncharacterized protein n=1 Tax=Nepenthes gracilis TaxID=150966 RepID=A0AAD3SHL9_NEPGR|nr:hypothetical protein Nepgr_013339 [Nepenthes gracilis]